MGRWLDGGIQAANTVSTYRNWCNDKEEASPDTQPPPFWGKIGQLRVGEKRTDSDVLGQK